MSQPLPATYGFGLNVGLWLIMLGGGACAVWAGFDRLDTAEWMRWALIGFGALAVLISVPYLVSKVGVSLDGDGFTVQDIGNRSRRYRWAEISDLYIVEFRYRGWVTNRAVGFNLLHGVKKDAVSGAIVDPREVVINMLLTGSKPKFACAVMNAFRARALGLPQPQA